MILALAMIPLTAFAEDLTIDENAVEDTVVVTEPDVVDDTDDPEVQKGESVTVLGETDSLEEQNQSQVNIIPDSLTLSCCYYEVLQLEGVVDEPLTWTSSDEDIVTVDADGTVFAVTEGEATITVESQTTHQSDTCQVTVKHSWVGPITTKTATITSAGVNQYECICGAVKKYNYYKSCAYKLAAKTVVVSKWGEKAVTTFIYDGKSTMYFYTDVTIYNSKYASKSEKGDVRWTLQRYDKDDYDWVNVESSKKLADGYSAWLYYHSGELKKGTKYRVIAENWSGYRYKVKCFCKGYPNGYATKGKVNKGKTVKVKARWKYYLYTVKTSQKGKLPLVKSVKSSNSKVAKGYPFGHKLGIEAKKKGKCTLTVTLQSGKKFKVKVKVRDGTPALKYNYINWNRGTKIKNAVLYSSKKVKWTTTNKKVATVTSKGLVKCVNPGTCYVKAKVAGKTLKCKVKVYRLEPDMPAGSDYSCIIDYKTRGNYFLVDIYNDGQKTMVITAGKKALDKDYKTYDRKLKLKKKVKIKPHSYKRVRFYVKGKPTWPKATDFRIFFTFRYDGKTYTGKIWETPNYYHTDWY